MSERAHWQKYNLTPDERDVLLLVMEGRTSNEITYKLKMPLKRVEQIRWSLWRKLEVTSLPQLIRKAVGESTDHSE